MINMLSQLEHDNVIKYYGYMLKGNILQIVTDYHPGGSIKSLIEEMGPLPKYLVQIYIK
jgi:serine/threonine protein kinase